MGMARQVQGKLRRDRGMLVREAVVVLREGSGADSRGKKTGIQKPPASPAKGVHRDLATTQAVH